MFDFIKKIKTKAAKEQQPAVAKPVPEAAKPHGHIDTTILVALSARDISTYINRFVAIDLETTGLNYMCDDIVEFAAVVFEDGKKTDCFDKLAKPCKPMPKSASAVNGITDAMLCDCDSSDCVALAFYDYLKPYLDEGVPLVAHNADFDLRFLMSKWQSLGISKNIEVLDTLRLSRKWQKDLKSHTLTDAAASAGVPSNTDQLHRASYDAEICGLLLISLLNNRLVQIREQTESFLPLELECAKKIVSILQNAGENTEYLVFDKAQYLRAIWYCEFLRLKLSGKLKYIIIPQNVAETLPADKITDCSLSEKLENKRFSVSSAADLDYVSAYIIDAFHGARTNYDNYAKYYKDKANQCIVEAVDNYVSV